MGDAFWDAMRCDKCGKRCRPFPICNKDIIKKRAKEVKEKNE